MVTQATWSQELGKDRFPGRCELDLAPVNLGFWAAFAAVPGRSLSSQSARTTPDLPPVSRSLLRPLRPCPVLQTAGQCGHFNRLPRSSASWVGQ